MSKSFLHPAGSQCTETKHRGYMISLSQWWREKKHAEAAGGGGGTTVFSQHFPVLLEHKSNRSVGLRKYNYCIKSKKKILFTIRKIVETQFMTLIAFAVICHCIDFLLSWTLWNNLYFFPSPSLDWETAHGGWLLYLKKITFFLNSCGPHKRAAVSSLTYVIDILSCMTKYESLPSASAVNIIFSYIVSSFM